MTSSSQDGQTLHYLRETEALWILSDNKTFAYELLCD